MSAERLADVQKKIEQLKAQEKKIKQQIKNEQRKKDTHIKCILGGTVLKVLRDYLPDYDFQEKADEIAVEQLLRGFESENEGTISAAIECYREEKEKAEAARAALTDTTDKTEDEQSSCSNNDEQKRSYNDEDFFEYE